MRAQAPASAPAANDIAAQQAEREALMAFWPGTYDISEELVFADDRRQTVLPRISTQRLQIVVQRVLLPSLGSHVLYVEEFPYDDPADVRRRVLLSIELAGGEQGTLRVRQFSRKPGASLRRLLERGATLEALTADDMQSDDGCDLWLRREGSQFRGGSQSTACLDPQRPTTYYLDYQVVLGQGLFWYRKRRFEIANNELIDEVAGFRHVDLDQARLFNCGIAWAPTDKSRARTPLPSVDLHDRGGRARFATPDGRAYDLELHGRDWPLSSGRESLVLILSGDEPRGTPLASSWTTLDAARVAIDIGWLVIDCAPVVPETGDTRS